MGHSIVCIYHAHCADGFGAAYVVWRYFKQQSKYVNFFPKSYGEEIDLDLLGGADVYIVDFSFSHDVMVDICNVASKVTVLDHHKTALPHVEKTAELVTRGNFNYFFDLGRSGAFIAWEYFFPIEPIPWLIQAISDRDLWQFKHSQTKAYSEALRLEPWTFERWDELTDDSTVEPLTRTGELLLKKQAQIVDSVAGANAYITSFDGFMVPICNAVPSIASDLGNLLCKGYPFAIIWWYSKRGCIKLSLRSSDEGEDVSEIAKKHDGGGHRNAAGCELTGQTIKFPIIATWVLGGRPDWSK